MFTPTTAVRPRLVLRSARMRAATATAPALLKPMRLRSALSPTWRHSRGRSLPGCAWAVTVPTSTKPKPSIARPSTPRASLSKPAARPNGPATRRPNTSTSASVPAAKNAPCKKAARPGTRPTRDMSPKASSCARSGSMRRKRRLNRRGYTRSNLVGRRARSTASRAPQQGETDDGEHEGDEAVPRSEPGPHRRVREVLGHHERGRSDGKDPEELEADRDPRHGAPPPRGLREGERRDDVDETGEEGQRVGERRLVEAREDLGRSPRGGCQREQAVAEHHETTETRGGAARLGRHHEIHSVRTRNWRKPVVRAATRRMTELQRERSMNETAAAAGSTRSTVMA